MQMFIGVAALLSGVSTELTGPRIHDSTNSFNIITNDAPVLDLYEPPSAASQLAVNTARFQNRSRTLYADLTTQPEPWISRRGIDDQELAPPRTTGSFDPITGLYSLIANGAPKSIGIRSLLKPFDSTVRSSPQSSGAIFTHR